MRRTERGYQKWGRAASTNALMQRRGGQLGERHPRRRANKYRGTHNRASKRLSDSFMNPRRPRTGDDRGKGAREEIQSDDGFSP